MKKFISQFILVLILSITIFSQNVADSVELVDEFGEVTLEDILARSDNLAHLLNLNKNKKAVIRTYRGKEISLITPYFKAALLKAYLLNDRKIKPSKVIMQYCKSDEIGFRHQFLILPQNMQPEKCNETIDVPDKTIAFSTEFSFPKKHPINKEVGCCPISGVGAERDEITLKILLYLIKNSDESKIYLIGYAGDFTWKIMEEDKNGEYNPKIIRQLDSVDESTRFIQEIRHKLVKKGISSKEIVTIQGGYKKDKRTVEIWFVPRGGEIPKPKPDYFPSK